MDVSTSDCHPHEVLVPANRKVNSSFKKPLGIVLLCIGLLFLLQWCTPILPGNRADREEQALLSKVDSLTRLLTVIRQQTGRGNAIFNDGSANSEFNITLIDSLELVISDMATEQKAWQEIASFFDKNVQPVAYLDTTISLPEVKGFFDFDDPIVIMKLDARGIQNPAAELVKLPPNDRFERHFLTGMMMFDSALAYGGQRQHNKMAHTLQQSKQAFKEASVANPVSHQSYHNIGIVHCYLGDYFNAQYNIRKALELSPEHTLSQLNLGIIFTERRRWEQALEQFELVRRSGKEVDDLYLALGNYFYYRDNPEEALRHYKAALQHNSHFKAAFINRANTFVRLKQMDKAKQELTAVLEFDQLDSRIPYYLGIISHLEEDFDRAEQYYDRAVELNETFAFAYFNRAVVTRRIVADRLNNDVNRIKHDLARYYDLKTLKEH